jgi:hypothetical protein
MRGCARFILTPHPNCKLRGCRRADYHKRARGTMPETIYLTRFTFAVRRIAELWYEESGDLLLISVNSGEIRCVKVFYEIACS